MKGILKKVARYFAQILFVVFMTPIVVVKAIMDPALQMMIALVHALLNADDDCQNAIKEAVKHFE